MKEKIDKTVVTIDRLETELKNEEAKIDGNIEKSLHSGTVFVTFTYQETALAFNNKFTDSWLRFVTCCARKQKFVLQDTPVIILNSFRAEDIKWEN